ncbi:MAG: STAS domain-containing protein [Planctomycetota bacterium]
MKIDKTEGPEGVTLIVSGDVDMESSPKLRDEIKKCLKAKPGKIRLRLHDVPYIDSSGVAVLIEGMRWCKKKGADYSLVAISDNVKAVLDLSKLYGVFTVEAD